MSLSGERESLLTREIEDLKSKLMTRTREAIKSNSEVCTVRHFSADCKFRDPEFKYCELIIYCQLY